MTNIRNFVAIGATVAAVAMGANAYAQDDLDNLLQDLASESAKKPVAQQAAKEAEKPVAAPAAKAAETPAETVAPVQEKKPDAEASGLLNELKNEDKAASAPAKVAEAEKPAEEKPAEAVAEKPAKTEVAVEAEKPAEEKPAEAVAEKPAKTEVAAEAEKPAEAVAEKPAKTEVAKPVSEEDERLANILATEKLRRTALDSQARREIEEARECMRNGENKDAIRHYGNALKLLNDGAGSEKYRKECDSGIAEGLYRDALQEDEVGRREKAMKLMEQALDMRHPKARRVLAKWAAEGDDNGKVVDISDIKHRMNDGDYKQEREQIRKHLRRSRQYLAVRDMDKALEECEVVLVNDPYNQEAIRQRNAIQKKRQTILQQERKAARDGMIADVDEAWRPVYAVNAAQLNDTSAETVKAQLGEDPERTMEQEIERRMKEMRLPEIQFKPPATIMDAVDWFRTASKDYDRPDIPVEKRGFNFVLKTPQPLKAVAGDAGAEANDFSDNGGGEGGAASNGLAPIPTITASDITFYEALKLVCDSVEYKFIVRGPVVMVMQKDMSTAELLSRKYDVLDAFLERMTAASSDVKEMKSSGFGGGAKKEDEGEENQERDWKAFFEQMGVKWPEGSSIMHIKTLGKLYVRNTRENLAEFEKVLQEMGSQTKLIEIETRFVEVSQTDLNSLGFEWILNSDYSLNIGDQLGKALHLSNGTWGTEGGNKNWSWSNSQGVNNSFEGTQTDLQNIVNGKPVEGYPTSTYESRTVSSETWANGNSSGNSYSRTESRNSHGANWIQGDGNTRNLGINAFGGTSDYSNGSRYLSTVGNHISGESKSTNDQFMRVNAFLGTADLSMILHMLAQRSDTDLLSAPKVVTKSGENAVIKVVTEYIYPQDYDVQLQSSSSSSSSGSGGGSSSAILAVVEPQNFTTREVGVILDVTPTYSEANGGTIDLELKPSVVEEPIWKNYGMKIPFTGNPSSSIVSLDWLTSIPGALVSMQNAVANLIDANADNIAQQYVDAGIQSMNPNTITYYDAPMEQPFFAVRSIDSKVSITPGATVVMGGLITEKRKAMDDKIPFLGDLPFIGRLFRSHAEETVKRNLLIFVTGRLISPSGRELRINSEDSGEEAEVKAAPQAE